MIHIAAGSISLILFWIPVIVKKGSKIHNSVGRWYVYMMTIVVISAALLSIKNVIIQEYEAAAFLGYLAILTAYPLWHGRNILKHKKVMSDQFMLIRKSFNWALLLGAIGLLIYAYCLEFRQQGPLMVIFALLGLSSSKDILKSNARLKEEAHWIIIHLEGMVVSGIAAYTAFFAFGGNTFFREVLPGQMMIIPWILPTVIGVTIMKVMKKRYIKKGPRRGQ